jgi:hypothetical protein
MQPIAGRAKGQDSQPVAMPLTGERRPSRQKCRTMSLVTGGRAAGPDPLA